MRKRISIFIAVLCCIGLTACGTDKRDNTDTLSSQNEQAISVSR